MTNKKTPDQSTLIDTIKADMMQSPQSMGCRYPKVDPFPLEVYPQKLQEIARILYDSLEFPIDFTAAGMLYAVSLAMGNTHKIEVKHGWIESGVIYAAIVGKPGVNKSHPPIFCLAPIQKKDIEADRRFQEALAKYNKAENKEKLKRPVMEKKLVSDYTQEALLQVHRNNPRSIGVYMDELAGWFKNFNRYNSGSEEEFWNTLWSGKVLTKDRKNDDPLLIAEPFISVMGTIQPKLLDQLACGKRRDNGFVDRILFFFPDDLEKRYWSENQVSPEVEETYEKIINKALDLKYKRVNGQDSPQILNLSEPARKLLYVWQQHNTDMCNKANDENLSGMYSKLDIYATRFALILQIMRYICGEAGKKEIDAVSVEGAIKMAEYFRKTAVKVHAILNSLDPLDKLPANKRKLCEALPAEFTTENGLTIARNLEISERTFKRLLTNKDLFHRISRGLYERLF